MVLASLQRLLCSCWHGGPLTVSIMIVSFGELALSNEVVGGCGQRDCTDCDDVSRCTRCRGAIVMTTRQCVQSCPTHHALVHSDVAGYQGLLCRERRFLDTADITLPELSWLLAALVLTATVIGVTVGVFLHRKLKRWAAKNAKKIRLQSHYGVGTSQSQYDILDAGAATEQYQLERREFARSLAKLRPSLGYFLGILSAARTRYYATYNDLHDNATSRAYRTVIGDLGRVVRLLRADPGTVGPPADWRRVIGWAERIAQGHGTAYDPDFVELSTHNTANLKRPRSAYSRLQTTGGTVPVVVGRSEANACTLPSSRRREKLHYCVRPSRRRHCTNLRPIYFQQRRASSYDNWPHEKQLAAQFSSSERQLVGSASRGYWHVPKTDRVLAATSRNTPHFYSILVPQPTTNEMTKPCKFGQTLSTLELRRPTYRDWSLARSCHLPATFSTIKSHSIGRATVASLWNSQVISHPPGNRYPIRGRAPSPVM